MSTQKKGVGQSIIIFLNTFCIIFFNLVLLGLVYFSFVLFIFYTVMIQKKQYFLFYFICILLMQLQRGFFFPLSCFYVSWMLWLLAGPKLHLSPPFYALPLLTSPSSRSLKFTVCYCLHCMSVHYWQK